MNREYLAKGARFIWPTLASPKSQMQSVLNMHRSFFWHLYRDEREHQVLTRMTDAKFLLRF